MSLPEDTLLRANCRKIFVRNLKLDCFIGAYDEEKDHRQPVIFNCDVWVPLTASTSCNDNLTDVLNYDTIVGAIRNTALSRHFNLQETLVDEIADRLTALPGVVMFRLSSEKILAYPYVESVGIEIWRSGCAASTLS